MLALSLASCATNPTSLGEPVTTTCFVLKEPLVSKEKYGLFDVEWEVRLAPGLYISEKVDAEGTYFRAPPGGVYQGRPDQAHEPAGVLTHLVSDGGVYLPFNKAHPARIYKYFALSDAPVVPHPADVACNKAAIARSPVTSGFDVAMPGTASKVYEIAERITVPPSGPVAGASVVGGVIGGSLVSAMIANDIGKIEPGAPVKDPRFLQTLRQLGDQAEPVSWQTPDGARPPQ